MSITRWRVYYDDGTVAEGAYASEHLRGTGVIAIVQRDDEPHDVYALGRELLCDHDFYCWRTKDGKWFRCDLYGLFDYLWQPGWKKVLAGRTVERSVYRAILARAQNDVDFPLKNAWGPGEERAREVLEHA